MVGARIMRATTPRGPPNWKGLPPLAEPLKAIVSAGTISCLEADTDADDAARVVARSLV